MQIKLNNLKKTYGNSNGAVTAVNGVSLDIPENSIYGIIGKSGAGKSSLVRLISMLETPDEGEVFYGDKRVDNLSKKELIAERRKIGMIFQNFNLFSSRTAGKNIAYPMEIAGYPKAEINQRVKEMLELVELSDKEDAPVSTLSGGQKQRVAIARALSTKPDILFCDEATSALDPQTTRSILNLIRDIQKKMNLTVVMITHQMEVVRDACEQVAVIEKGQVVESGKVTEIFSNPQSSVTKDFISHIAPSENSQEEKSFTRWSKGGKYSLSFIDENTDKTILSDIVKKFGVDLNIRGGGIQHLPGKEIGTMVTDILGDEEQVTKAISYLEQMSIIVNDAKEE